jgi:hypothetical protein
MRYFLAHNSIDIFHHGELNEGQFISTGQPSLEYFDNLNALKERLTEFGVDCDENTTPNLPDGGIESSDPS